MKVKEWVQPTRPRGGTRPTTTDDQRVCLIRSPIPQLTNYPVNQLTIQC